MQPEQIMSSDLLDILFADRNKMYGAYTLRKGYNYRLKKALMITGALVCTALAFYFYLGPDKPQMVTRIFQIPDPEWKSVPEPKAPVPPPPPQPKQAQISTRRFLTPVVVPDPVKHDPPPRIDELINSQVGNENKAGIPAGGFPPPAVTGNGSAIAVPAARAENNDNIIVDKVDIESTYPGGPKAWKRFLIKTFRYPTEAEQNNIFGTVLIKFVVDKEGNVSGIQALSGPQELRAEAIRVISKSGKWTPAMQNGQVVNSYKYQQIVFQLSE